MGQFVRHYLSLFHAMEEVRHAKANKDVPTTKPKLSKKKAPVKATRDEGTVSKPGVPDVPKYDFKSDKESWGNSDEEDDTENDENDDDNDDVSDDKRTESDKDKIPDPNHTNEEQAEAEEEYDDERVHTPKDYELTDEEFTDKEDNEENE
ncbi:hypothetical protein Tco_0798009 [Tanacetum coccineum]